MNLFFGKISKQFDTKQIEEGYYQAPKDSVWFGDIKIDDYAYIIGGDKIQFWRVKEWKVVDEKDRLYFEILNPNLGIGVNDLSALNFLKISKALIILTSRSARKAFFELAMTDNYTPAQLSTSSFYKSDNLFRSIKIVKPDEIDFDSKDIQLYLKDDLLNLVKADFYDNDVYDAFRDNFKFLNQGSKNKDNILSIINKNKDSSAVFTRSQIGLRAFYDAFFCEYRDKRKYFLVGAFWEGHDPEDLTDLFVKEKRWENGYDDKFLEETKSIPKGSFIAIKSAFVRERSKSVMKIKAVGKVLKNYGDGHKLDVVWEENFTPFEVEFGGYMTTVKEVTNKEHIESIWENDLEIINDTNMNSELIDLLKYKKQIILQGPPGTGKTKLAKELAVELTGFQVKINQSLEIEDWQIVDGLKGVTSIGTVAGNVEYKVIKVDSETRNVTLQKTTENIADTNFSKIKEFYKNQLWNQIINGNDERRCAAIAKYLFDKLEKQPTLEESKQFKIIQFHPSYSYEDFVRGIVAESKGDKIEYKNVNKILGQFAAEAKQNWDDSKKDIGNISKENKAKEYFEEFVDELSEKITGGQSISLTPSVNLIDVDDDAFRYKGNDGWSALGNRMLFKDIIRAFLDGNKLRQDIKKNKNLSGLAIQHASYFGRVLNMFQDYLASHNLKFDNLSDKKVELKNYVLIIDEINRANLSSVLGELIYALEYRGENVESMYAVDGNNELVFPPNLYIIGTMNTADRSVGHIDYAIRRRFAFVDVQPKDLTPELANKFHKDLFEKVAALFNTNLSPEFEKKDVQLGHSYFIHKSDEGGSIYVRLKYEIKPILFEYVKDGILIGENIKKTIEDLTA